MRQSCILNFNPNFANNQPSDFITNFNKELSLKEKSEVALYNLQISRKPIVIQNDRELTLEIIADLPNPQQKDAIEDVRPHGAGVIRANNVIASMSNTSFTGVIERGEYTKREFLQYCGDVINKEIIDYNLATGGYNTQGSFNYNNIYGAADTPSRNQIPYYCEFKEDDNGLFFGLVKDHEPTIMCLDHVFGDNQSYAGNIQCEVAIQGMINKMPQAHTAADANNSADYTGNISVLPVDGDGRGVGDLTLGTYVRGRDFLAPCFYNKWDNKSKVLTGNKISSFEYTLETPPTNAAVERHINMCWWNTLSSQQFNGTSADANSLLASANVHPLQRTMMGPGAGLFSDGANNLAQMGITENMSNPAANTLGRVPLSFLGLRKHIVTDVNSNITTNTLLLYQNANLQVADSFINSESYRDYPYNISTEMEELATINCRSQNNPNGVNYDKFRWNFFAMDGRMDGNEIGKPTVPVRNAKIYYYQLLGYNQDGGGDWNILYDSQHTGKGIPAELFEDGEAFFNAINPLNRDILYTPDSKPQTAGLGFCPLFTFQGCLESDSVINPMGVFGSDYDGNGAAGTARPFIQRSIERYSLSGIGELQKIFGCPRTNDTRLVTPITFLKNSQEILTGKNLKNPNMYPQHIGGGSGYTRVFGDGIRYNVELNLPIKCFSTKSTSKYKEPLTAYATQVVQGNERPIVYNFGDFGKELTDSNETSIFLELEPNNLKFLSLDNNQKIKLNELKVKIRRAGTDEVAKEIEDCSLEILIQN